MKKLILLVAALAGTFAARADYSDFFRVQTINGEVENGGTVLFCEPSHINAGFYNDWYEYDLEMLVENVSDDDLMVTCTMSWGSYPTPQDYMDHFEEYLPGTSQWVYGFAKMCGNGYCYPPNFPSNLGTMTATVGVDDMVALTCQLLRWQCGYAVSQVAHHC